LSKNINRKEFLKKTTALSLGAAIYPRFKSNLKDKDKVRIGFIDSIKRGVKPPLDVYDAVSMSVILPLSEKLISNGSSFVEFPDFKRGAWKNNKPIFGVSDL
tara:strand:+ start:28 stop:333 length:306 start_codon:yes stop_codon:yes gene_type:complete